MQQTNTRSWDSVTRLRLVSENYIHCIHTKLTLPQGQSKSQLQKEFSDIRKNFNGRYIRLYGFCDNDGYYDDVVEAAWNNSLGVHALIWVSEYEYLCANLN